MMDFTQPWEFGDVAFIVEDKNIYANKVVLTLYSEVFRAMFTSDFKEKKMAEIPLPDKKFDNFLKLMQILHPPHDKCVDDTNVECVLPLAHEYQIHHVIGKCEKVLVKQAPSIHNLILADKFSLAELRKVCIEYIKDIPLQTLDENPDFKKLQAESIAEIYRRKLELGEELSKQAVCKLTSQPPSIQNFLIAQKHNLPEVYDKCLKYLKDTPLSQLKEEAGFTEFKGNIRDQVLVYKVSKLELFKTNVSKISECGVSDREPFCTGTVYNHRKGTEVDCSMCKPYICNKDLQHCKGTKEDCTECKLFVFDALREVIKKY